MEKIKRVIFAVGSGTTRAPMAVAIMRSLVEDSSREILARGLVVQFPEPLNQKAEAVLISNGLSLEGYATAPLLDSEITSETLVLTMEESQRAKILEKYSNATEENTYVLTSFVGEELEIMDPYGGPLQSYGLCYEMMKVSIEKLLLRIQWGE